MGLPGTVVQVAIALAVVLLLFVVGYAIYNMEILTALRNSGKIRRVVPVFTGYKDFYDTENEIYDTKNTNAPTYRALDDPVNQPGGEEFTYNFWLYMDTTQPPFKNGIPPNAPVATDAGITPNDVLLFVRGTNQATQYQNLCDLPKTDVAVKCPLVKLEQNGDVLTVEVNTVSGPDAVHEDSRNTCFDSSVQWTYMNEHKIALYDLLDRFKQQWFMVTIVLQDTLPGDPYPLRNKAHCRIYVNGVLELDEYLDGQLLPAQPLNKLPPASMLRPNSGPLIVAPVAMANGQASTFSFKNKTPKTLIMADLTYFNYALDGVSVQSLVRKQFNKTMSPAILTGSPQYQDTAFLNRVSGVGTQQVLQAFPLAN